MGRYEPIKLKLSKRKIAIIDYINMTLIVRGMTKVQLAAELQVNAYAVYNPLLKRQKLTEEMRVRIFETLKITDTDIDNVIESMAQQDANNAGGI